MNRSSDDSTSFMCSSCFLNKVVDAIYHRKKRVAISGKVGKGKKKKGIFSSKKGLLEHIERNHPTDDFSCPWTECGMKMESAVSMLDHMMEQHSETFGYVSGESSRYDDWCYFPDSDKKDSQCFPKEGEDVLTDGRMTVSDAFFERYPHLRTYLRFVFMHFAYLREKSVDISTIDENSRDAFVYQESRCVPSSFSTPIRSVLIVFFSSSLAVLVDVEANSLLDSWKGSRFCTVPDSVLAGRTGGLFLTEYGSWKARKNNQATKSVRDPVEFKVVKKDFG